jgi:long-chain acyl-CoA synthetase
MKDLVYHRYLLPAAANFAGKAAVMDSGYTATFGQHLDRVLRLADGMRAELGVNPGDRFAVMALNSHDYLELYHAGFLGAGVINPLNLRLAPMELEFILRDSGSRVIFADAHFSPVIERVRKAAGIEQVVLIGAGDVPHDLTIDELVEAGKPVVPDEPEEDDPVILMYTGGTTGLPKGVLIDNRAAMLHTYKIGCCYNFTENYVYLHQTPMFHAASFGGILVIAALGAANTFVPLFNAKQVLDVIEEHQVSCTTMVPTMIQMLLDHPEFRPERMASMRVLTYGASPMPTTLLQRLLEMFPDLQIFQGYGMTENCGLLTMLGPDEHRRGGQLLKSAGRPVPGSVVCIQDPEGNLLPAGQTGEVCARGGNYMKEYWHRPEETEAAFAGDWYHTGDAGYLDEDGFVFLVDRVKDMIVTGGENVYSAEVENALGTHPAVKQIAVIGIPDEKWGEAVHAIVVRTGNAQVTADELKDWARERIAGYKVPKSIEFRDEDLPLSGAMKILKRQLRAPYWEKTEKIKPPS